MKIECRRHGFSLIELMVVLAIISIVAATVTFQFAKPYRAALFKHDLEAIVNFDNSIRRLASTSNQPGLIVINLERGQFHAIASSQLRRTEQEQGLSNGVEIETVRLDSGLYKKGQVQIPINAVGGSATYAICLANRDQKTWLLFVGGSGQCFQIETEEEIDEIFQTLQTEGIDAG